MFQGPWAESTPRSTSSLTSKLPPFRSPTRRHCLPSHTLMSFSHCVKTARTADSFSDTSDSTQHRPGNFPKVPSLPSHTGSASNSTSGQGRLSFHAAPHRPSRSLSRNRILKHQPNRTPQINITLFLFLFSFGIFQIPPSSCSPPPTGSNPSRGITRPPPKVKPDQDSQESETPSLFLFPPTPHLLSVSQGSSPPGWPTDPVFPTRYSTTPRGNSPASMCLPMHVRF